MRVGLALGVILLVVMAVIPVQALEPWALYDNFDRPLINPNKWSGSEGTDAGYSSAEAGRLIQGGRLRIFYRGYANMTSNSEQLGGALVLRLTNPNPVTAIRTTVAVRAVEVRTCPLNPSPTVVRADLSGYFFNTGVPGPLGDSTNDVTAKIRLQRRSDSTDPPGIFQVIATAFRCADVTCFVSTSLGLFNLGTVSLNQPANLALTWDRDNHRFIYQFGSMTVVGPYTVPDTSPPANPSRALRVQHVVPNCTTPPRPNGFIDASFDDVFVNASAAPRRGDD